MSFSSEEEEQDNEEISSGLSSSFAAGFSRPRRRAINGVLPEHFVEALAIQVAIEAARTNGKLSAASAVVNVFKVCSTWRAVSRSEFLWKNLTCRIWDKDRLRHATWHDEYVSRHKTARNFRIGRAVYTHLEFDASSSGSDSDNNGAWSCRCLALSELYLACGFLDGSVRVFDLASRECVTTFRPHHPDRLGSYSTAISGIGLYDNLVAFASFDGNVYVGVIPGGDFRQAHVGNVVNDGTLVDFTGCRQWWVGLFAGVPGRAFHVWDAVTEQLVFSGDGLTDPDSVTGWRLLTEPARRIGRVHVSGRAGLALAATGAKVSVYDLMGQGILGEEENVRGLVVDSVDVCGELFLVVDNRGLATVRRIRSFEEVCRFVLRRVNPARQRVLGCLNGGYAFTFVGGAIGAWDIENGHFLYSLRERIGEANDLVADDQHVAGCSTDTGIHLWDFSSVG